MSHTGKKILLVSAYAIAMAFVEAVAVVYLRGLLYITGEHVTLERYVTMETGREVATVVMLVAVGWMAGRRWPERLAYGLFTFGLWDIWYYIWLKVLIGWPETLLDWDILFMIPLRWWGPVLAPVIIAALICLNAVLAIVRMERGERLGFTPARVGAVVLGGLLALYVFMSDSIHALLAGRGDWDALRPGPFQWPLFLLALALMALPSLVATWPARRTRLQSAKKERKAI
jgi:hypothetical protein